MAKIINTKEYTEYEFNGTKWIIGGMILLGLIVVLFGSTYIIEAGERGVLLTFGKPSQEAIGEGLHFKIPLAQTIKKMDVKTQKYVAQASGASKDLQVVSTEVAVNYKTSPERTPEIYQKIGLAYEDRIIQPAVQEGVKAVTAKFTAEELVTRRPEVKDEIRLFLLDRLQERGMIVEEISITNFDFSESFNTAIEAKVTAEQQKLKAERDLERIRIEAEQKIAQAEAEAESIRIQSEALKANPDILELRAIEKWNGIMPQVTGGAVPFIGINGAINNGIN